MKLYIAFLTSVVAAVLTITFGFLNGIHFSTLISRSVISFVAFGFGGYLIGFAIDQHLIKYISSIKTKGQNIDIITKEEENSVNDISSFSPLTPDKFETISTEKSSASGQGVYNE